MASSDDDGDALPSSVSNYHFIDDENDVVSFSELPIQWTESEQTGNKNVKLFLLGYADKGLQSIHKHVIAWKFDLSKDKPEVAVLSKENSWIKLEKPRKSFESTIRSILVTVQWLHFLKRNPEASEKSLWDHLFKLFGSYEDRPSESDLEAHKSLITEVVDRNIPLAKSKLVAEFLKKEPRRKRVADEGIQAKPMAKFIVSDSDDDIIDGEEDDESDEADDKLLDSVCSFCDNGGNLLCCDGSCLRSFHATEEDDEGCDSLGFTPEQVNAMELESQVFLCKNCELKRHQCFICGELGSSDRDSGAEVFRCAAACGLFYHPQCVAERLHGENKVSAEEIAEGKSFTCPVHKCYVCKQRENVNDTQLQFAVCRRCPMTYHRKCMPKEIFFENEEAKGIVRAWEGLLPNRILIYCLEHEIDEELGTPLRNHIKFPEVKEKKRALVKKKPALNENKQKQASELLGHKKKIELKTRVHWEEPRHEKTASILKQTKKSSSSLKPSASKSAGKLASGSSIPRKVKVHGVAKRELKSPRAEEGKSSLGNRLYAYMNDCSGPVNQGDDDLNSAAAVEGDMYTSELPPLDADSEKRVLDIMKSAEASVTIEGIKARAKLPSTHTSLQNYLDDKSITHGKVETSVQAIREAVRILDEGGSTEDAELYCSQELLKQIFKWKNKIKSQLTPFLHGMRYTSFGRHFTKVEKLVEIVNRLHWYLNDGDTLVDFCCGSNDFSVLMKKKLIETRKKCSFKNYDLIQAKNDVNFEIRDWMTVKPDELPPGGKLVMGLNPPFGVRAALANKFIDKALEFKPKLIILIVPPETQRLDKKRTPYDLIWEDDRLLSGKSFYLPGSINARDKQMDQWNTRPPLLYLWSHPDWSAKHRSIAKTQAHICTQNLEAKKRSRDEPMAPDQTPGSHDDDDEDYADVPPHEMDEEDPVYGDNPIPMNEDPMETDDLDGFEAEGHEEASPCTSTGLLSPGSNKRSKKQQKNAAKNKRRRERVSAEKRRDGGRSLIPYIPDSHQNLDVGFPVASHPPIETIERRYLLDDPPGYEDNIDRRYFPLPDDPGMVTRYGSESFTGQGRDSAESIRLQVRRFGQSDPMSRDMRFSHLEELAPASSGYGRLAGLDGLYGLGSPTGSQISWSQTQPVGSYHNRLSSFGSVVPRASPFGSGGLGPPGFGPPILPHHGLPGDPQEFAPGRHENYPHHGPGGWIP